MERIHNAGGAEILGECGDEAKRLGNARSLQKRVGARTTASESSRPVSKMIKAYPYL